MRIKKPTEQIILTDVENVDAPPFLEMKMSLFSFCSSLSLHPFSVRTWRWSCAKRFRIADDGVSTLQRCRHGFKKEKEADVSRSTKA